MPSERLQVILELVTGQYKREALGAAQATGKIGDSATSAGGGLGRLQGGFNLLKGAMAGIGLAAIAGQFRDMAGAAIEDAESQTVLANALRTNVGATDDMIASNERWISSMQVATRTADTDLRQAITDLTVSGRSLEEAQKDIAIATDIAASKGIELGAVIKALVRAQASGSTGGLARLGIQTKNAAGEMLTYDEVLKNAAKTMGGTAARAAGTLAGALERSKIAMEEAREEAGDNFAPALVELTDTWNEFKIALLGGNKELAGLQSVFDSLITNGIDPFEDQVASAGFVLAEFARQFREPMDTQTFETLVMMLGLTNDQVVELRRNFLQNGDALDITDDKLANINGLLDEYVGVADPAVLATRRYQKAQQDAAAAAASLGDETGLTTEELREQRDLLRELTDPVFAVQKAVDRLSDAQERAVEAASEAGTGSREYDDALSDVLLAVQDLEFAQQDLNDLGPESQQRFIELAAAAGIPLEVLQDFLDRYLNIRDILAEPLPNPFANWQMTEGLGFPVIGAPSAPNVAPPLTVSGGPKAFGGPVSANQMYLVGERGPEMFVSGTSGSILSNDMLKSLGKSENHWHITSPMNDFRSDLQTVTLYASLVNYVEGM